MPYIANGHEIYHINMETLPNDFVSLPIIITDYDAIIDTKKHTQVPTEEIQRSQTEAKPEQQEEKGLGITESVEEIWSRISDAMKTKLREACIEVLRRTDATPAKDGEGFQYDDDARFLD